MNIFINTRTHTNTNAKNNNYIVGILCTRKRFQLCSILKQIWNRCYHRLVPGWCRSQQQAQNCFIVASDWFTRPLERCFTYITRHFQMFTPLSTNHYFGYLTRPISPMLPKKVQAPEKEFVYEVLLTPFPNPMHASGQLKTWVITIKCDLAALLGSQLVNLQLWKRWDNHTVWTSSGSTKMSFSG